MRSRPITLIRSYAEPLAFRLFTTGKSRAAPVLLRPTQTCVLWYFMPGGRKLAEITGRHFRILFRLHNPLEICVILAITIWSINPRKMSTRPPDWSGRTNHLPGRNLDRLGRALVSSPAGNMYRMCLKFSVYDVKDI